MCNYKKIHPNFKLNGFSYSKEELREVAYSLIKEGKPYEIIIGDFLMDWLSVSPTTTVKTSGSTGKPKIMALKKEHMSSSALATANYFDLEAGSSALLCLNTNFIAGKMMLVRAMVLGMELDYVAPNSSPLKNTFKKYDFVAMVPLQVEDSLKELILVKTLIVGGAAMSKDLKGKLKSLNTKVYETYGMTETITHIAIKEIKTNLGEGNANFNVLPNVQISQDKRNCLIINAPNISNDLVITNDIVRLISDTEFQLLGRFDNIINSGGIKLIPEEIESKLSVIIENRFFVAGIPDEKLGQKLILVVEGNLDSNKIMNKIKATSVLQKTEIPKDVVCILKFSESNDKVQKEKTLRGI
ncbi:MAG: O-succinylbenzoic acid--CoA ligase [Flavobacteriaceae bacterium]|nr:MAG: O-succinylbenzoic acid--CoA ligase [Flavobacteriaceae bacterium]